MANPPKNPQQPDDATVINRAPVTGRTAISSGSTRALSQAAPARDFRSITLGLLAGGGGGLVLLALTVLWLLRAP